MKVLIFGGTGLVGRPVVEKAVAAGHEVTVFTRNKKNVQQQGVRIVEGSVQNSADVARAVKDQQCVIQCIGIGGRGDGSKTTVASDANRIITKAMQEAGVRRYIAMSVIGAGDSWQFLPWIYRKCLLPWFQKWFVPIIDDKNRMEADIHHSGLDWTVVRGTTVKDAPAKDHYKTSLDGKGISFSITAPDLADFIVSQIEDTTFVRQSPVVCN